LGHLFRERLRISNCCLTKRDSATTKGRHRAGALGNRHQQMQNKDDQIAQYTNSIKMTYS